MVDSSKRRRCSCPDPLRALDPTCPAHGFVGARDDMDVESRLMTLSARADTAIHLLIGVLAAPNDERITRQARAWLERLEKAGDCCHRHDDLCPDEPCCSACPTVKNGRPS